MPSRISVTFAPSGVTTWVSAGTTVLEAAKSAGILLVAPCGGRGVCGACAVRVVDGALAGPDDVERAALVAAPKGIRLACRATVATAVRLSVPSRRENAPELADGADAVEPLLAGVDLGTTSVAAVLIEAESGRELARVTVQNRQQIFGADVLSRVSASLAGHGRELSDLVERSVLDALAAAATASGTDVRRIQRVVLAGNSAMAALLAESDMSSLSGHPFTPPFVGGPLRRDSALLSALAVDAEATVLPPVAGFVGGDALAAVIGAGLVYAEAPILLVDFGTNAEIILADRGALTVASAAAGPAFEGAGLSCGGPATDGAVVAVRIDSDGVVHAEVLGGGLPTWFSGSGLVSAMAALRRLGHLSAEGLLTARGSLEQRFFIDERGVVGVSLGREDGRLSLNQLDVRVFQLGKAAVRVGVEAVLSAAGVEPAQLTEVLLAGAFGSALDVEDLIELGVLPRAVMSVTRSVGNAALDGAAAIVLDHELLLLAEDTARAAHHVELAADPSFNVRFLAATALEPFDS